jgi:hypothetical protein
MRIVLAEIPKNRSLSRSSDSVSDHSTSVSLSVEFSPSVKTEGPLIDSWLELGEVVGDDGAFDAMAETRADSCSL